MSSAERLRDSHRPLNSKKRKNNEVAAEATICKRVSTRQIQQLAGDVVGVYCGGGTGGDVDHTYFWLAKVQAKSRADARIGDSPVMMRADAPDPHWDIDMGEYILNTQWLKRDTARVWRLAGEQIITLTSVLPVRVVWDRTTTHKHTLSQAQHHELTWICECVRELDPRY